MDNPNPTPSPTPSADRKAALVVVKIGRGVKAHLAYVAGRLVPLCGLSDPYKPARAASWLKHGDVTCATCRKIYATL
jgi:hypothetical protein